MVTVDCAVEADLPFRLQVAVTVYVDPFVQVMAVPPLVVQFARVALPVPSALKLEDVRVRAGLEGLTLAT